jgi:hypothetical protein
MIDVAASVRHSPVVQADRRPLARSPLNKVGHRPLGDLATVEGDLVLGPVCESEQEAAKARVCSPRSLLAVASPALILTREAGARPSTIQLARVA